MQILANSISEDSYYWGKNKKANICSFTNSLEETQVE